ncbi:hypothetical protein CTheo_4777 [Ceratobasidium theobromae]|uniref:Mnd1 HTH domain-containing protein n=1 Tax=Ceratobasidium theobromae TaxID=1582974 RepID=A0A5N5QJ60_9AGAM|nr:hypothetical protein CTheo_4777 [Ceratobasidium theobromae]
MAPRGLSAEEKRVKLVELFHETRDFYQLKELEKLAPKMKGIVSQSVKEVLQSLVDDNLLTDHIQSFGVFRALKEPNAKDELAALESKIATTNEDIQNEIAEREDTPTRRAALALLQENRNTLSELESEMDQYGLADPVLLERKRRAVILAREAALRWTGKATILAPFSRTLTAQQIAIPTSSGPTLASQMNMKILNNRNSRISHTAWVSRPVGGIPVSTDLAPSIVFAILYALLLPNIIYNFFFRKPRAWNAIQISTVIFAVERIAWCTIRAIQAAHPEKRGSGGLMNYVQATVGLGFIGISSDAIKLLRSILVHSTLPESGASEDRRGPRGKYRIFCIFFELAFLAATIPGIIASGRYSSARNNQALADKNMGLLYASSSVVLALQFATVIISLWAAYKVKEIERMRCFELAALTLLIIPVPVYRLCVLHIRTSNVFEPLSSSARVVFYIIHLVPEWICVSVLLGTNVRTRFRTGRWGDYEVVEHKRDQRLAQVARDNVGSGRSSDVVDV